MEYEKLQDRYRVNSSQGLIYLIKREKDICLFESKSFGGSHRAYEVHKIKFQKYSEAMFKGKLVIFKAKEMPRTNDEFGNYAFCYQSLELAEKCFKEMVAFSNWESWEKQLESPPDSIVGIE